MHIFLTSGSEEARQNGSCWVIVLISSFVFLSMSIIFIVSNKYTVHAVCNKQFCFSVKFMACA